MQLQIVDFLGLQQADDHGDARALPMIDLVLQPVPGTRASHDGEFQGWLRGYPVEIEGMMVAAFSAPCGQGSSKATLPLLLPWASMAFMGQYQCWFCGNGIEQADTRAVMIFMENLWQWDSGTPKEDRPFQTVYAHSACTKSRLKGATMELGGSLFVEDDEDR